MEEEWEEKLCRLSSDVRREREEKGGGWLVVEEHSHRDCLSKSDSRVVESLYACNGRWKYQAFKVE